MNLGNKNNKIYMEMEQELNQYDMIFLDIEMPEWDGVRISEFYSNL